MKAAVTSPKNSYEVTPPTPLSGVVTVVSDGVVTSGVVTSGVVGLVTWGLVPVSPDVGVVSGA